MDFAPVCLFTYNRLAELQITVEALRNNFLAGETKLFIFVDGPKETDRAEDRLAMNEFLDGVTGFQSVEVIRSPANKGLAQSVIRGVTQVVEQYDRVIVLEDDLLTSPNFLDFMNQALEFYAHHKRILSISGHSFSDCVPNDEGYDVAFGLRACSWGWGTWKDRWRDVDWQVSSYGNFRYNIPQRWQFNRGGSDMASLLDKQMAGKINSWAIRFCYHQFKNQLLDVFPVHSKVLNIGFNPLGTNCKYVSKRYFTLLDTSQNRSFHFRDDLTLNQEVVHNFYNHYSYTNRIKDKIQQILWKPNN